MRNKYTRIFSVLVCILLTFPSLSIAQIPDDVNGRLWRLCKTWGYAKYFHENGCAVNWNAVLLGAIDSILVSTSTASFNETISEVLAAAGQIPHASDPLVVEADINLNAHFDWMDDSLFTQEVRDNLDSILVNFRPGENCFVKINDGSDPNFGGRLSFSNDNILNIPSFSYSVESNRLLALFYYWNIINYFHPDKDLMDQDWDSTLFQFIPLIRQTNNDIEFHIRFLNLVTYLNDTHGFTLSSLITEYLGGYFPLLQISNIENQTVVTKVGPGISDISVGDLLKKINGTEVDALRDSLAQYNPASNNSSLQRDLDINILEGAFGFLMNIELEDSTGAVYTKLLKTNYLFQTYNDWINDDSHPTWEITQCGYGYVDMGKLYPNQVSQMYDALKETPAIIFDVRNYPNGAIFNLIRYLLPEPATFALFTEPDLSYPGWYNWYDNKLDGGSFSNPTPYNGKVIILVNATTQSHAEYTVMGLQQHPNAYTIGSQTAGADGNVSYITLPGSLRTYWTSLGVYYPDTMTAQRVGVRIDSLVTPTIQGIRNGKDEVLEAAFDCLTSADHEFAIDQSLDVYPNPVDDLLFISTDLSLSKNMKIEIFDMLGHLVSQRNYPGDVSKFSIDINVLSNGFYIVSLKNNNGVSANRKIMVQH